MKGSGTESEFKKEKEIELNKLEQIEEELNQEEEENDEAA